MQRVRNLALSLAVILLAATGLRAIIGETNVMANEIIEGEFGTVVDQILTYPFMNVPAQDRGLGQERAISSARNWAEAILQDTYQPKGDVEEGFHRHADDSCDAVRIHYVADTPDGAVELWILQTLYSIVIVARPDAVPDGWATDPGAFVTALAKRLFVTSERIAFGNIRASGDLLIGEQTGRTDQEAARHDWLETIRWWTNGDHVGFAMLKNTGGDQAVVTTWSPDANRQWFAKFERSRTR